MKKQDSGHIANTASMAGLYATPAIAPYTTTKYGVVGPAPGTLPAPVANRLVMKCPRGFRKLRKAEG